LVSANEAPPRFSDTYPADASALDILRVYRLLRASTVVVVGDVTRVARSHGC